MFFLCFCLPTCISSSANCFVCPPLFSYSRILSPRKLVPPAFCCLCLFSALWSFSNLSLLALSLMQHNCMLLRFSRMNDTNQSFRFFFHSLAFQFASLCMRVLLWYLFDLFACPHFRSLYAFSFFLHALYEHVCSFCLCTHCLCASMNPSHKLCSRLLSISLFVFLSLALHVSLVYHVRLLILVACMCTYSLALVFIMPICGSQNATRCVMCLCELCLPRFFLCLHLPV